MKRAAKSRIYQTSQPGSEYKVWKDLSFFGCIASGILLAIMVLALLSPENGIPKVHEVRQIKKQLEEDITYLQEDNGRLLQQIEAMKTDPFWLEKIAREELNMGLPGEIIYKFAE